jgi:hypothetical protein
VIARDHDILLHPNARPSRSSGRVLLEARVMTTGMDDQVTGLGSYRSRRCDS